MADPMTAGMLLIGGGSLLGAKSTLDQGSMAREQAKTEATAIETQAAQREADRKDRLLKVMASQSAMAGAGGVAAFQGSPLAVLDENIRQSEKAQEREDLATKVGVTTARTRGKVAYRQSRLQAATGLLQVGGQTALAAGAG